jgi:hypothetical protein
LLEKSILLNPDSKKIEIPKRKNFRKATFGIVNFESGINHNIDIEQEEMDENFFSSF